MDWLHFLNLQYWYCIIYSLFGGECAYLEELRNTQNQSSGGGIGAGNGVDGMAEPGFFATVFGWFSSAAGSVWSASEGVLTLIWNAYSALAWGVSLFLFLVLLFALAGLLFIRMRELSKYGTLPPRSEEENIRKSRWEALLEEAMTSDPKAWRHAILEADMMLGELLEKLGYAGATTADKMRALPEDAFVTVPQAWEAHRVRNFVSQGQSDFILTQREAFRIMKLYEQVFEEFDFI